MILNVNITNYLSLSYLHFFFLLPPKTFGILLICIVLIFISANGFYFLVSVLSLTQNALYFYFIWLISFYNIFSFWIWMLINERHLFWTGKRGAKEVVNVVFIFLSRFWWDDKWLLNNSCTLFPCCYHHLNKILLLTTFSTLSCKIEVDVHFWQLLYPLSNN